MDEKERQAINSLVNNDLGDLRFITDKIKKHYPYLKNNIEYKTILDAIESIYNAEERLISKLEE